MNGPGPSGAARRSALWRLVRIAVRSVGPVLLAVVLWRFWDSPDLSGALRGVWLLPLALAVALNLVAAHAKLWRWRILLATVGYPFPTGRAYRAFLPSIYLGMVTPGRVGDLLRVQYLRHDLGMPYAQGLAVSVVDRLFDIYVLLAFVAGGVAHFASVISGQLAWATWGGMALIGLTPAALFVPGLGESLGRRLWARHGVEAGGPALFLATLRRQVEKPGALVPAFLLTVAAFCTSYGQGWLIGRSLGLPLSFVDVIGLVAISTLLSLLPISISGVGVREAFYAAAFPALAIAPGRGVAFGLGVFVVLYLPLVLAGFVAWQVAPPPFGMLGRAADPGLDD